MTEYRVSVLVTFYNQEKYVDRALGSIISQKTDFGIKIIIGDDGSTDNTQYIIKEWIKKYPDTIELHVMKRTPGKHIAGFRASRNRLNLLKYVNTDYFLFLDGDDFYISKCKLQKQVDILDKRKNRDCIACGHNSLMIYSDGISTPIMSKKIKNGKYTPKEYWNKLYFHTDSLMIRSNIIQYIDFKLLENNFNDNMITFLLIQKGKIYYLISEMVAYMQTGDGVWTAGKAVINNIRNMFLYDLCNIINPKMKKETMLRFSGTWKELLKIRKSIDLKELKRLKKEAYDKKLYNSIRWISYNNLGPLERQKLCLKAVFIWCWSIYRRIVLKIFH